jgi:hypothetical protein
MRVKCRHKRLTETNDASELFARDVVDAECVEFDVLHRVHGHGTIAASAVCTRCARNRGPMFDALRSNSDLGCGSRPRRAPSA